jgi:hypothetical protein
MALHITLAPEHFGTAGNLAFYSTSMVTYLAVGKGIDDDNLRFAAARA